LSVTQARAAIATFVALLIAILAPVRAAVAAAPEPPVVASLGVTGPADCVARAEVVKLVARRSPRIHFDGGAAAGPALRIEVDASAPRAVAASLSIAWPDGSRSERHLTAPTCAETADALALVVVLALDPAAAAREAPAPPAREPPPPARPVGPTARPEPPPAPPRDRSATTAAPTPESPAPARVDDQPAPAPPPPPEPATPVVRVSVAPPPVEASPPPVHRFDVGGAVRFASGPAPSLMPGLAVVAGWERDTGSVFSWKVQLTAAHHARNGWSTFDGSADFTLDLVTLAACPLRVGPHVVRARLCASAAAGRIVAAGTDTLAPRTRSRPFATVGGAASLAVSPFRRVEIAATVEPQAALIRDQFAFGSNVFHDVPPVVLFFGLGAAATFP